ncbi:hypothetical protein WA588_003715, partial [Blastocystis sp. NMH]
MNAYLDRTKRSLQKIDFKKYMKANRMNFLIWAFLVLCILVCFHFFSDGDFSFLLTLGSVISAFGFGLILFRSITTHSVSGISLKSLQCYALVYLTRTIAVCNSSSYLPFDKSGDWFYQCVEGLSFVIVVFLIYLVMVPLKYTHNSHHDTFGQGFFLPKQYTALYLIVPALVLTLIIRPHRAGNYCDFLWTFAMYLEGVAIYPQLHMFQKNRTGEIESFTSHFVFSMAASKFLNLLFWLGSWKELNSGWTFLSKHFAGLAIITSQVLQLVLMSTFIYYYIRSAMMDAPMVLPTVMN